MTDARPNVVLVTIDSLRADHCGFAGYDRDTTPTLDAMAREGITFEHAIAPGPSTPESMPAVFTGRYPLAPGNGADAGDPDADDTAPTSVGATDPDTDGQAPGGGTTTLESRRDRIRAHMETHESIPERLSRLGYATAGFTPNPFTSRYFGFDRGFDRYEDFMDESRTLSSLYDRVFDRFLEGDPVSSMGRVLLNLWQREEVFKPWESYADEALAWAREAPRPYFLWVFLMDAHNPYMTGNGHRNQARWKSFHANYRFWRESHETPFAPAVHDRLVTAYDDSVRYADAFLERVRSAVGDDTVVVVHGDHGEAFGEHGVYGHEPYLYEENVHVPLVVAGGPAGRATHPVSLRSLPDLLTDAARGDLHRAVAVRGNGPLPTADSPAGVPDAPARASDRPVCFTRTDQGGRTAVRGRTWKYVATDGTGEAGGASARETADASDGGRLYDVTGRTDEPMDAPELRELGADLLAGWSENRAELGRIRSGVAGTLREGDA